MKGELIIGASIALSSITGILNITGSKIDSTEINTFDKDTTTICCFRDYVDSIKALNDSDISILRKSIKSKDKDISKKIDEINKLRYDFQDEEYPIQLSNQ